MGVTGFDDDV